jgi:acetolactate synthase regulatory subunit
LKLAYSKNKILPYPQMDIMVTRTWGGGGVQRKLRIMEVRGFQILTMEQVVDYSDSL